MSKVESYRDLQVWQQGIELVKMVYTITVSLPDDERFGLTSQMRRSAVSVPSNIAEGHTRDSLREYLKHLSIAIASLAELETQIILTRELGYLTEWQTSEAEALANKTYRMLRNLQKALRVKLTESLQPTT